MKQKSIIILALMFSACQTTSTMISGSWTNVNKKNSYNKLIVASLTSNTIARATVETDLVNALREKGINAEKSIDKFPPKAGVSDTDKVALMERVKQNSSDAILTVSLLNTETDSRYVPGSYRYDPYAQYPYYGTFWGYYSYRYPYVYEPAYYETNKTYYIETNLYNVSTEELIWSAQSATYNPVNLTAFSREFAGIIVSKMEKDGVIARDVSSR
jgi:hypothetical protein